MAHNEEDVKIGLPTIWAIGVGSALGGDFFGWEFILYGGFFSALMAVGEVDFCGGRWIRRRLRVPPRDNVPS